MKDISREHKVFDFFKYGTLALLPILNIYKGISFVDLGFAVLLLLMILEIILNRGRFEINADMLVIFSIMIVLNIITGFIHMRSFDVELTMKNALMMILFMVVSIYYVRDNVVNKDRFYKFLCVIGVVCSLFTIIQYVLYLRGTVLYGIITWLPSDYSVTDPAGGGSISYGRPPSFFTEPAHFAIYILPVYTLSLFKRKFGLSLLFLMALILSTSSTGMMGAIIVTGVFIIKSPKIPLIIKWIFVLIGILLFIQFLPDINESGVFEKVQFVNLKSNIRVFGSLEYFKHYDAQELLFGVGLNRLSEYLMLTASRNVTNYANALIFSFLSFGILGGSIWTYFIFTLHRLSRNKMLFVVFLIAYVTDQILFNRNLFYLLLILYVFSDKAEKAAPEELSQSCGQDIDKGLNL